MKKRKVDPMRKEMNGRFYAAVSLLAAFVLWTLAVCVVDVKAIGPYGSKVGLAAMNQAFHEYTGLRMSLYRITDWLSLVPIAFAACFAFLGMMQWVKRKHLLKVDQSILVLGGFYLLVAAAYVFFEIVAVNDRPVLIDGVLEASYPSSTTMLVICVMTTAILQLHSCIRHRWLKRCTVTAIIAFMTFMVIGRLISGVHWLSDVIGGAMLSATLVMIYQWVLGLVAKQQ